jgi:pyridoxamine 5'-phosphate oxidase
MADVNLRREYTHGELRLQELKTDPIEQFALWFAQAQTANVLEPNAMSLATVSASGQPSLRTVLMKSFDQRGFVFYTNLQSRKAREIGENAKVALLFPWIALERQVIIAGSAEKISWSETLKYFMTRPRGSQIGAWVANQSSVITSRKVLEMQFEHMLKKFAQGDVPLPSFWGGFRVKPIEIEFWQGRENRLHDRFMYRRQPDESWKIDCLSP